MSGHHHARRFPRAAIATPHHLASSAGLAVLASGGNAVDAAVAANLVLGVVTPYHCGLGGDLLALVHDGDLHAYRSVGRSAAAATREAVVGALGTDAIPRLRIGIGDDFSRGRQADYVLSPFTAEQQPLIDEALLRARDAAAAFVTDGLTTAMNRFN